MSRSDFGKRDIRSRAFFTGVVASGRKAASRFGVNGIANLSTNHCGSSMTLGKIQGRGWQKEGPLYMGAVGGGTVHRRSPSLHTDPNT